MSCPYRLFYRLHLLQCRGNDTDNDYLDPLNWENAHREESRLLWRMNVSDYDRWYFLYKGYAEDGWNAAGADKVMDVETIVRYNKPYLNNVPVTAIIDQAGVSNDLPWDIVKGTGRFYDGATIYTDYPHKWMSFSLDNVPGHTFDPASLPVTRYVVHEAWCNYNHAAFSISQSADILANGMLLGMYTFTPNTGYWSAGKGIGIDVDIKSVKLRYFNACANSLSVNSGPVAGGWPLVLTGLGFANSDADINSKSGPLNSHAWADTVYRLYLEKPDGTVVTTLNPGLGQFVVDSNAQITIPAMPALPKGIYQIRIHKQPNGVNTYSYAGDWRTDPDGRMTPGARLYVYYGEPKKKKPAIKTKWKWRKGGLTVFKYWAPIDTRTPDVFYDGLVLSISPFTRGTNDLTGLPILPDMEIEIDNTSRELSKLLASYWCKNQLVEIWFGWQEEPNVFSELIYAGIVSDYDRPGPTWKVKLKDILEKYFSADIPKYRCTSDEFPYIHPQHNGRIMPEVLGLASLATGTAPGAVEAVYVDTVAFKYLAARGSLNAVLEVYSDGNLKTESVDYEVSYEDGGRTYLTFVADQGNAKITFNCEGYEYPDWDSANGYIQNPAYILLFLLAFISEIPDINVDIPAFDDLADLYEALGFDESGYLIMQDQKTASSWLQELLFTFGAKQWSTTNYKVTIGRKDVGDIANPIVLFDQIDALEEPDRPQGFDQAVNFAPVQWNQYPTANLFLGAKPASRPSSIIAFEAEISPAQAWSFPWTDDEDLVDMRTTEELLKLGFGDQGLDLRVSLEHHGELEILDTFRFQDPYGLDSAGRGEVGRYNYVGTLGYDLMGCAIKINAVDLEWQLRQLVVLGDEDALSANWSAAVEAERLYAYLADDLTGLFADGEPGKTLYDGG